MLKRLVIITKQSGGFLGAFLSKITTAPNTFKFTFKL